MPDISRPTLAIEPFDEHSAKRRVRVTYDLVTEASDPLAGHSLDQRIELHAVDANDAALPPSSAPVSVIDGTVRAAVGTHRQEVTWAVHRLDLDVEQDLWRGTPGGEPELIAEWLDHLTAEIRLSNGDTPITEATTPEVTGSWGVLGAD